MSDAAWSHKTYIVEHLDPELEDWSALEYKAIAEECYAAGAKFVLSSVPPTLQLPAVLQEANGLTLERKGVEELYASQKSRVCLLDPAASKELSPTDADRFDMFLFGGILGDDPPRDRTRELRKKGYEGRRLGPVQMTTDTAVRVTRTIIQDGRDLHDIDYIDEPDIRVDEHESVTMPFRYVKGGDGRPVMPNGMVDLIKEGAGQSLEGLL